ncbi:MAG: Hfq-like protein [Terracidiphilus sp.]
MNTRPTRSIARKPAAAAPVRAQAHADYHPANAFPFRIIAHDREQDGFQQQAELLYLQKQIQAQTPMVLVLENGDRIEGCIEWYDRNAIKVRGRTRTLVYKSAIKYMYKVGEGGL